MLLKSSIYKVKYPYYANIFRILINGNSLFLGIISVRRALDREKIPEYHLQVTAADGGGLSCMMDVYITLTDVNDFAPIFSERFYEVSAFEDAPIDTLLTRVVAVDHDLGL